MEANPESERWLMQARWVRGLAGALVSDASEAEDLAQETLAAALERGASGLRSWRAWARAVLRNSIARGRRAADRREARERAAARAEALPSELDNAARLAVHRQVVAAVEELDEPFRTVVLLRYFDELPPRDIAQRLGVPVKTVNSRLQRAHARLRQRLASEHGGDERQALFLLSLLAGRPTGAARQSRWLLPLAAIASVGVLAFVLISTRLLSPPPEPRNFPDAADGLLTAAASELQESGAATGAEARREATSAPVAFRGRVLTADGEPVEGADIELVRRPAATFTLRSGPFVREQEIVARARSDGAGMFHVEPAPEFFFDLIVRARSLAPFRVAAVAASEEIEVRMERAATLKLHGRDESGQPVDAMVEIILAGNEEPFLATRTVSASWSCSELPPVPFVVRVRAVEGASEARLELAMARGQSLERTIVLPHGMALEGTVRSAIDGLPIAGAELSATADGLVRARTDAQGRYRLHGLSAQRAAWEVRACAPGFAAETLRASAPVARAGAPLADLDFELAPGWSMRGRVVNEHNEPIGGAWIVAYQRAGTSWDQREAQSDLTGSFAIADLDPGADYAVLARVLGLGTELVLANRPAGSTLELAPIVIRSGASLSGRVRTHDMRPVGGARVGVERLDPFSSSAGDESLSDETIGVAVGSPAIGVGIGPGDPLPAFDPLLRQETRSRFDGTYRMVDLAPGRYRVWALSSAARRFGEREVVLSARDALAGIDLVFTAGKAIAGRVLDPDRQPLPGAWVLLFKEGNLLEERSAPVEADGSFRFEGLDDGIYSVSASYIASDTNGRLERPFARTKVGGIELGREDVEVVLARNVILQGIATDESGAALSGAIINAVEETGEHHQGKTDATGRFEIPVPEGRFFALEGSWSPSSGIDRWVGRMESVSAACGDVMLSLCRL